VSGKKKKKDLFLNDCSKMGKKDRDETLQFKKVI
jgi:hypothetical protein